MSKREGEVREVPFLKNDMKDQLPATGRCLDRADCPGKADAECGDREDEVESKGNITINVDDAQLDQRSDNQTTENKKVTTMRRIYSFTLIAVGLSAGLLLAQSDSDYQGWMKTVGATNGSLQKNIAAKDGAAASADAAKLADTFKQVASYWEAHSAPDAVGFAKGAQSGFEMVGKDAAAGDFDKAAADAKAVGRNCGGCHMAHREKTDAGFKIK